MNFIRSSGVLLHPSSIPTNFGIGDLGPNAYKFIDFLVKGKQKLWQILPLGPTSFGDSPYQSFSTFAGNPMLISPELLAQKGYFNYTDISNTPNFPIYKVDYGNVIKYKETLLKKAFNGLQNDCCSSEINKFKNFCTDNKFWLDDFALFVALKYYFIEIRKHSGFTKEFLDFENKTKKFLNKNIQKDYYFGAVWSTWPEEIIQRTPSAIKYWSDKLSNEIEYYKFLQYEFFSQWNDLKKYANKNEIKIIGDIPIFVAFDSADTWSNPHNYFMKNNYPTVVAGVPPDYFSETGQLWGNPLYDWNEHKKDGYKWWISRIKNTLSIVDIVRIDHFRGFESYWAVPFGDKDATGGKWCKGPNTDLFHAIEKALGNLPIIAEDLGIITDDVTELRHSLGFPGMKVLQFAFDDSENNDYLPHNYNKYSVVYTGTHDNDTTNGWYKKASSAEKDKYRRYMNVSGEQPSWDLIRLASGSVAVFAIYPLQDVLELDDDCRMNTPSTASGNWQFRYTEDMLNDIYAERLAYITEMFAR